MNYFKHDGHVYELLTVHDITPREVFQINAALRELGALNSSGTPMTWGDLMVAAMSQDDLVRRMVDNEHPETDPEVARFALSSEAQALTAITIWASLRRAGRDLSIMEAFDIPASAIDYVAPTEDRQAPKARTRQASAAGARGGKAKPRSRP